MSQRIYDRPDLDQRQRLLALLVVGSLPKAVPMVAYEGRLQIYNAVGACTVRQIDGDTLPPGHRIYVDQATSQVVIAWPPYQAGAAPIANPGFEDGSAGWQGGAGWAITTLGPITGAWAGEYKNNRVESVLSNTARYEVYAGQRTEAKCSVRQGASAEGNAGASVMLEYRDAAGDVVLTAEGNRVMSASKGAVYPSSVVGIAPAGAATVNIASNGIRYRENKPLFVDDFTWDHVVAAVGLNHDAEFRLTLQVTDSAGRSTIWRGFIGDQPVYFTSKPYSLHLMDGVSAAVALAGGDIRNPPQAFVIEGAQATLSITSGELRTPLAAFAAPPEAVDALGVSILSGELRQIQRSYLVAPEGLNASLSIASGTLVQVLITTAMKPEGLDVSTTIVSGTLV